MNIYKLSDFYKADTELFYEAFNIDEQRGQELMEIIDNIQIDEQFYMDIYQSYQNTGQVDIGAFVKEIVRQIDDKVDAEGPHELSFVSFMVGYIAREYSLEAMDSIRITENATNHGRD